VSVFVPRLIAVLDSNIYRGRGAEAFEALKRDEDRCGVLPMANFWSVMELASHLLDAADDPARGACMRALQRLWEHCHWNNELPFAGDSESQMALTLFGVSLPGRRESASLVSGVVKEIAAKGFEGLVNGVLETVKGLRAHRDQVEREFASDMEAVVQVLDPKASAWQPWPNEPEKRKTFIKAVEAGRGLPFLAETLVLKAADASGQKPSRPEIEDRARFVLENFPTPLAFYDLQVTKLVQSGAHFSKSKHANSIWDMQLCYYALPDATILGFPVLLVSDEGQIHEAARRSGASGRVMRWGDYVQRLTDCSINAT
jgi:hypothetical protein